MLLYLDCIVGGLEALASRPNHQNSCNVGVLSQLQQHSGSVHGSCLLMKCRIGINSLFASSPPSSQTDCPLGSIHNMGNT
jgi:hypothetical protein